MYFVKQKYRCNAEPAANPEELNNDTPESVFDKLLEGETNNEENRGETIAAAVAAAVAPRAGESNNKVSNSFLLSFQVVQFFAVSVTDLAVTSISNLLR